MTPVIRPFRPEDAVATHGVFRRAVHEGTLSRYSAEERAAWLPDDTMPPGWGDWLERHFTVVADRSGDILGFMMLERDGYLNMAYVLPSEMGKGTADSLYAAVLTEARLIGLGRLTTLASRFAIGFFTRHGWRIAPDLPPRPRQDMRQGPHDRPVHRPMALDLAVRGD